MIENVLFNLKKVGLTEHKLKRPQVKHTPIRIETTGKWVRSKAEKPSLFVDYLKLVFTP